MNRPGTLEKGLRRLSVALPAPLAVHEADLRAAAEAALRGGEAAMRHYRRAGLDVEEKGRDDPVTEADHAANRAILACLAAAVPADPVVSEESAAPPEASAQGRLWLVDPLDGTKEFIAANGEFSVMVGLVVDGAASLGAVYAPDPDRLYVGVAAGGAWVAEGAGRGGGFRPLRAPGDMLGAPLRLVRSRSHPDPRLRRLEEGLGDVRVVQRGSVGIKCTLIAEGGADLYVHPVPYLKEWDTCAPEAVLRGAGGRVTDCRGRPLSYGKPDPRQRGGIFAGRPDAWERAARVVATVAP